MLTYNYVWRGSQRRVEANRWSLRILKKKNAPDTARASHDGPSGRPRARLISVQNATSFVRERQTSDDNYGQRLIGIENLQPQTS